MIVAGNAKQMPKDVRRALVAIIRAFHPVPSSSPSPAPSSSSAASSSPDSVDGGESAGEGPPELEEAEAERLLTQLADQGRYILECWF